MLRNIDDARFWNRIARKYATHPIKDLDGYDRTLDRICHFLSGTDSVLELGCGTGTTALKLAPHVRRILATDASSEMIAIARERASAQACENVEFATATSDCVPAPDSAFDAVLAFNMLHLIADRASLFSDVHRLLKPGGVFISKTPCLSEMNPLIRLAVPVMRLLGKAPTSVAFFSATELESELMHAGFTIVERGRHGSGRKDARIFFVARETDSAPRTLNEP